jgi:hypothetical protein
VVDTAPPPAVSDLACKADSTSTGAVSCSWTAVSDGASGSGVDIYQVRYVVDGAITAANFDSFASIAVAPYPKASPAGSTQALQITGLSGGKSYAFAVKGVDHLANVAAISNLPAAVKLP